MAWSCLPRRQPHGCSSPPADTARSGITVSNAFRNRNDRAASSQPSPLVPRQATGLLDGSGPPFSARCGQPRCRQRRRSPHRPTRSSRPHRHRWDIAWPSRDGALRERRVIPDRPYLEARWCRPATRSSGYEDSPDRRCASLSDRATPDRVGLDNGATDAQISLFTDGLSPSGAATARSRVPERPVRHGAGTAQLRPHRTRDRRPVHGPSSTAQRSCTVRGRCGSTTPSCVRRSTRNSKLNESGELLGTEPFGYDADYPDPSVTSACLPRRDLGEMNTMTTTRPPWRRKGEGPTSW